VVSFSGRPFYLYALGLNQLEIHVCGDLNHFSKTTSHRWFLFCVWAKNLTKQ